MPAYNFQAQFAELVAPGRKRQTIRPRRKRPTRPGEVLYNYTGMRTKQCRKLIEAICRSVTPVDIPKVGRIAVGGVELSVIQIADFARADGFATPNGFFEFFRQHYGIPCVDRLELIIW